NNYDRIGWSNLFRILELIGLLAPIAGLVFVTGYRRRSAPAFKWGITACLVGCLASACGIFGIRFSILSAYATNEGFLDVTHRLAPWQLSQFLLLLCAGALLLIAA